MRVLISGFEAFGGNSINPTQSIVESIRRGELKFSPDVTVETTILPVTYEGAFATLNKHIETFHPDVILALGMAGGRSGAIELERVAINVKASDVADNSGLLATGEAIDPLGPAAYFSTLPIDRLVADLKKAGVQAVVSNSAGTYVCNALFYHLQQSCLHSVRRSGFVHLPWFANQAQAAGTPEEKSMELSEMLRALSVMVHHFVKTNG